MLVPKGGQIPVDIQHLAAQGICHVVIKYKILILNFVWHAFQFFLSMLILKIQFVMTSNHPRQNQFQLGHSNSQPMMQTHPRWAPRAPKSTTMQA